jgi:hypothetical protein
MSALSKTIVWFDTAMPVTSDTPETNAWAVCKDAPIAISGSIIVIGLR